MGYVLVLLVGGVGDGVGSCQCRNQSRFLKSRCRFVSVMVSVRVRDGVVSLTDCTSSLIFTNFLFLIVGVYDVYKVTMKFSFFLSWGIYDVS